VDYVAPCFGPGPSSRKSIGTSTPVLARRVPEGVPSNELAPALAGLTALDGPVGEGASTIDDSRGG